jgi:hypothetical protein
MTYETRTSDKLRLWTVANETPGRMLPLIHAAADELDALSAQIRELRAHVQYLEAVTREVA